MAKRRPNNMNRGRFQAQGDKLEKSRPWAIEEPPTKVDGHVFIAELKNKLTNAELRARETCFKKATNWVDSAKSEGYVVKTVIKTSFYPSPPIRDIRVDGEIYSGVAFKD